MISKLYLPVRKTGRSLIIPAGLDTAVLSSLLTLPPLVPHASLSLVLSISNLLMRVLATVQASYTFIFLHAIGGPMGPPKSR